MKLKTALSAAAVIAVAAAFGAAQAQDMRFFKIASGSAGGTYYPMAGLIANAVSNPPGSRPCEKRGSCGVPGLVAIAMSANGSVANVNAIQAGIDSLADSYHTDEPRRMMQPFFDRKR